jgi:hypothetical protein
MPTGTLVATFGYDERHVLPALRLLPYDGLVLVAGRGSLRTAGYARIKALEPDLETVIVDPFDLSGCLLAVASVVRDAVRRGRVVRVSVSGGTKILGAAALLAAFQEGVEAWSCDPEPVRLPVLRGVRFVDALPPGAREVGEALRGPTARDRLFASIVDRGVSPREARAALAALIARGLAEERLDEGRPVVVPTAALDALRPHLGRTAGKA